MVANLFSYEREIAERAREEGIEEGIKEGIKEGIQQNTKNLAKMMLINFEPIDKIKFYTKLKDEQINALQKEIFEQ